MASNNAELNGIKCPICLGPTYFESRSCINWFDVQKKFILKCKLGEDFNVSYVTVPVSSIIPPLITFPDYGGDSWSHFFTRN